ncbi:hypothetical protein V8B97DRAFT_1983556 [Scleroderma yunnanense]
MLRSQLPQEAVPSSPTFSFQAHQHVWMASRPTSHHRQKRVRGTGGTRNRTQGHAMTTNSVNDASLPPGPFQPTPYKGLSTASFGVLFPPTRSSSDASYIPTTMYSGSQIDAPQQLHIEPEGAESHSGDVYDPPNSTHQGWFQRPAGPGPLNPGPFASPVDCDTNQFSYDRPTPALPQSQGTVLPPQVPGSSSALVDTTNRLRAAAAMIQTKGKEVDVLEEHQHRCGALLSHPPRPGQLPGMLSGPSPDHSHRCLPQVDHRHLWDIGGRAKCQYGHQTKKHLMPKLVVLVLLLE